jgi:hypothetical protein
LFVAQASQHDLLPDYRNNLRLGNWILRVWNLRVADFD